MRNQTIVDDADQATVELIESYAETWHLLEAFDEGRLQKPDDVQPAVGSIELDQAIRAINIFRRNLTDKGMESTLFGNCLDDDLESMLCSIEQTMFGEPLYVSREERAAQLLYLIVKDHHFTDGNKRIGALLFLLYLKQQGIERMPGPRAMTAITLLIAQSAPENKDLMIGLVMNLLTDFG